MSVLRLKMLVGSVKKSVDHNGDPYQEELTLNAVYGDVGTTNAQWSRWTTSASLNMSISNSDAFGKLLPGQFVFVDLTITDKDS